MRVSSSRKIVSTSILVPLKRTYGSLHHERMEESSMEESRLTSMSVEQAAFARSSFQGKAPGSALQSAHSIRLQQDSHNVRESRVVRNSSIASVPVELRLWIHKVS